MCWSVKPSLIMRVLRRRGLCSEDVPGYTDAAVRIFKELIGLVPSRLAEAQNAEVGLEGYLKPGGRLDSHSRTPLPGTHAPTAAVCSISPKRCALPHAGRYSCVRQLVDRPVTSLVGGLLEGASQAVAPIAAVLVPELLLLLGRGGYSCFLRRRHGNCVRCSREASFEHKKVVLIAPPLTRVKHG